MSLRTLTRASFLLWTLAAGAFTGTTSCVTAGNDFKSETSWLKEGHTKQEDVRMILGEPRSVGSSSGRTTWTYGFYRYFLVGDSYTKELKIYWKPDGTISSYSFTSSFPDDKGETAPSKNKPSSKSGGTPEGGF